MKVFFKLFIVLLGLSLSPASHAFPELPFCPAGGPPGWMNYFNDKRDQNNWRRYSQYYATPAYRQPAYYRPAYRPGKQPGYQPAYRAPRNYPSPRFNYRQNYYPVRPAPYRRN